MDKLKSVAALTYEGNKIGYRITGVQEAFDISVAALREAGFELTGIATQIKLVEAPDGQLKSSGELKGKVVQDATFAPSLLYVLLSQYRGTVYRHPGMVGGVPIGMLQVHISQKMGTPVELRSVPYWREDSQDEYKMLILCESDAKIDYMYLDDSGGLFPYVGDHLIVDKGLVCAFSPERIGNYGLLFDAEDRYTVESPDTSYPAVTRAEFEALAKECQARKK